MPGDTAPLTVGSRVTRKKRAIRPRRPGSCTASIVCQTVSMSLTNAPRAEVSAETAPAQPQRGLARRVARAILWPLRRFFDPRFAGVYDAVQDIKRLLITDM